MTQRTKVPLSVAPLTVEDTRELLAPVLRRLCEDFGPTKVGQMIGGADDGTVRGARDERSTLRIDYAANLLPLDGTAFDPFLARVGRRSVPVESVSGVDALPAMTGAVHRLASGNRSHRALLDAEPELRAAFDAIGALLQQCEALRAA